MEDEALISRGIDMHKEYLVKLCVSVQKSFNQTNIIEYQPTRATHNLTKIQGENINYGLLIFPFISFMIAWAIVVFIVSISSKFTQNRNKAEIVTSKLEEQVPCRKCRYFHNDHYLKCAVHPYTALTKQALNCSDYCPKQ